MADLVEVAESHLFECPSVDENGNLKGKTHINAIVNVFSDGRTEVLCPYHENATVARCNPYKRSITKDGEDCLGVCPYAVKNPQYKTR